MNCTYRGCATPPIARIDPPNGARPWYGCAAHEPAMAKALSIGCASDLGARSIPLAKVRAR